MVIQGEGMKRRVWKRRRDGHRQRYIVGHAKDVQKADTSLPIFIRANDKAIVDGAHRVVKARIDGSQLLAIPLSKSDLNKVEVKGNYTGQIFRDEDDRMYNVSKIIKKYNKRRPKRVDPNKLNLRGVWGKTPVNKVIKEARKNCVGRKAPKGAQRAAIKALEWKKRHPDEVKAMTPVGWARARQLSRGDCLSDRTIQRMANFNRHRKNKTINPKYKDKPWKDRGYVAWLGWGGDPGVDWAIKKTRKKDSK
jgi:hypothetical protein